MDFVCSAPASVRVWRGMSLFPVCVGPLFSQVQWKKNVCVCVNTLRLDDKNLHQSYRHNLRCRVTVNRPTFVLVFLSVSLYCTLFACVCNPATHPAIYLLQWLGQRNRQRPNPRRKRPSAIVLARPRSQRIAKANMQVNVLRRQVVDRNVAANKRLGHQAPFQLEVRWQCGRAPDNMLGKNQPATRHKRYPSTLSPASETVLWSRWNEANRICSR